MKHLILGGARSGKSRFAESLALSSGKTPHYIATAQALDKEMNERISLHQEGRDERWLLTEEPLDLHRAIHDANQAGSCLLVDCLTLWLSNCLAADKWPQQRELFLDAITSIDTDLILISNEVGSGIVPMGELSRQFVDESGWLHQALAEQCDKVTLVVAGLPLALKE